MFYLHGEGGSWMVMGGVWMLVFWAGLVGLGTWGILRLTSQNEKPSGALEIVRQRYSRGEIG